MTHSAIDDQALSTLAGIYSDVRGTTEELAAPLSPEDQTVQSMPDVSPTKWHRAHTTWFFETFLLEPSLPGYEAFDCHYAYLFNSYYESLGSRHPRPSRGLLSRPSAAEIGAYRAFVDDAMQRLIKGTQHDDVLGLVELGVNHEQQHQELLLMDIKHVLSQNVPQPAYGFCQNDQIADCAYVPSARHERDGGLYEIGHPGDAFTFDNELPRHTTYLRPFAVDSRPVVCKEWIEFIEDDGYSRAELWFSDGWATCQAQGWEAPLYWYKEGDSWHYYTLKGPRPVRGSEPVCHVSYYEADAFARWKGARLPSEAEWEIVAESSASDGNFMDTSVVHPQPVGAQSSMYGDVWQWTSSPYGSYPGFKPAGGAVGEYNGKFMVNQFVLRGGCCVTPPDHVRSTYRNFFPPSARWPFTGLRLAHDN